MELAKHQILYEFQQFIGNSTEVLKYLHNTYSYDVAQKIIAEGFRYEKYLENTADFISGIDLVVLRYFRNLRSSYGDYTIIIQISKELADNYSNILKGTPYHFTEVLTTTQPTYNSEDLDEPIYTLSPQFIKGYFFHGDGTKVLNLNFAPNKDCDIFQKNARKLLNFSN